MNSEEVKDRIKAILSSRGCVMVSELRLMYISKYCSWDLMINTSFQKFLLEYPQEFRVVRNNQIDYVELLPDTNQVNRKQMNKSTQYGKSVDEEAAGFSNDGLLFLERHRSCQLQPTASISSIASHDFEIHIPSSTPFQPSSPVPFEQHEELFEDNYEDIIQQNTTDGLQEAVPTVSTSTTSDEAKSSSSLATTPLEADILNDPNILEFFMTPEIVESTNPFSDHQMPPLVRVEFESLYEPRESEWSDDENSSSNHYPATFELEADAETMKNFNQDDESLNESHISSAKSAQMFRASESLCEDQAELFAHSYLMRSDSKDEALDEHKDDFDDSISDIIQIDDFAYSVLKEEDGETVKDIDELSEYQESESESESEDNFTAGKAGPAESTDLSSSDDESESYDDDDAYQFNEDDEGDEPVSNHELDEVKFMRPSEYISSLAIDDDFFLLEFPNVIRDLDAKLEVQPKLAGDINIYLSEIFSPVHFWFQCEDGLVKLEDRLENDYGKLQKRQLAISDFNIKPGLLVACYLTEYRKWHRALVINGVNHKGSVRLFFLDYGTVGMVHHKHVKFLFESYLTTPRLSFRGRLNNLKPPFSQNHWEGKHVEKFLTKFADKKLTAKIIDYSEKDQVYEIDINVLEKHKTGEVSTNIRDWLLEKHFADHFDLLPGNIYPICYYLPTIEMLENNYPTYSELTYLLEEGVDINILMETDSLMDIKHEMLQNNPRLLSMLGLERFSYAKNWLFSKVKQ